jgi:hypothetical protein
MRKAEGGKKEGEKERASREKGMPNEKLWTALRSVILILLPLTW